ncbi:hypothetical protein Emed_006933 [Eimeria media]
MPLSQHVVVRTYEPFLHLTRQTRELHNWSMAALPVLRQSTAHFKTERRGVTQRALLSARVYTEACTRSLQQLAPNPFDWAAAAVTEPHTPGAGRSQSTFEAYALRLPD